MKKSYKGKLLIATPDISGDIFSRSVILIAEHNDNGAFGLMLNKINIETSILLKEKINHSIKIFEGGPMENNKIFAIVKGNPVTDFFISIDNNYYLTEDIENIIIALIQGIITENDVKFFSGYSGWGPMQLDTEMKENFWIVAESYQLDYTTTETDNLWKRIMQNLGGKNLIWANAPHDISLN